MICKSFIPQRFEYIWHQVCHLTWHPYSVTWFLFSISLYHKLHIIIRPLNTWRDCTDIYIWQCTHKNKYNSNNIYGACLVKFIYINFDYMWSNSAINYPLRCTFQIRGESTYYLLWPLFIHILSFMYVLWRPSSLNVVLHTMTVDACMNGLLSIPQHSIWAIYAEYWIIMSCGGLL